LVPTIVTRFRVWLSTNISKLSAIASLRWRNLIFGAIRKTPLELPIQIDITNACNLKCTHCYHHNHSNSGALEFAEWVLVLKQYRDLIDKYRYSPSVIISGGEPLASPLLIPIIDCLREMGLVDGGLIILTNGTFYSEAILNKLRQIPNIRLQISIDGPTAALHDEFRGRGAFDKTVANISKYVRANIFVSLLTVLSKRTSAHINEVFELANNLGVKSVQFTRLIEVGYAANIVQNRIDRSLRPLELKQSMEDILICASKWGKDSSFTMPLMHLIYPGLGGNGKFWEGLVVSHSGELLVSSRSRVPVGNILSDGLENLWTNSRIIADLRSGKRSACFRCSDFNYCGGDRNAAYFDTGSFLGMDPGCWKFGVIGNSIERNKI
jgi:MoaA/NifB/PqqE/SkfB family radical SAM enzyme